MYAIAIDNDKTLTWCEQPSPGPLEHNEVRIRVAWAGMNRADSGQRAGNYPPPPGASDILGLEVSGTIAETGSSVSQLETGQKVCALLAGGGYAEEVVVDQRQIMPIPEGLGLRESAALPEMFATAWLNLFMEGGLDHAESKGERVLLHAGASSVGSTAVQLCRTFGYPCFVTVGSDEKIERCKALGAEAGWNRHDGSFVEAVKEWGGGVDVILDPVGADYLADNQKVLNADGRLVLIAILSGRSAELDLGRMLMKRQRLIGSTLRSKSPQAKGAILDELQKYVWPHLSNGDLQPLIDSEYSIQEAQKAMEHMENNSNVGKILLSVAAED
ncbi:NAD(P)H-quinone oxidoreductase [Halomonas sp. PR-M31]|uniref:NAD(P)H-quinone oxidoreductase n=1 Tax=Halomonas sp. PR-M31 TaxID=1471202 RepID=UPI000651BADB|nr:NAD(P)H-quinone oxidoreductase [Halomonas sp. PR-M31]